MLTFDSLPQARVVRNAGKLMSPPRAPREAGGKLSAGVREGLALALGLWPLTGVMLLGLGLLYFAGMAGSP